ncbi:MAG: hypothetical protein KDK97_22195, partial [Verrucomicrobiales bacterium]|nr:hypothetical protein [Verrucomicrobiales bacterium]
MASTRQNPILLALLILAVPMGALAQLSEEEILPLPQWQPGDAPMASPEISDMQPPPLLGLLPSLTPGPNDSALSPTTRPDTILTPLLTQDTGENSPAGVGYRSANLSTFLPESLLNSGRPPAAPPHTPTSASMLKDVDAEFLRLCSVSPASELLIDPLGLITEVLQGDLERFLNFHSQEARFPLYIVVLKSDEKLPADADLSVMASGGIAKKPTAVLAYPIAEPWRARLFLPKLAHDSASDAFLKELLEACVTEAMSSPETDEQLHRFCVELSTRLFWLEKLCPIATTTEKPLATDPHLQEVVSEASAPASAPASLVTVTVPPTGDPVLRWVVFVLCLLAAIGTAIWHWMRSWKRSKARRQLKTAWI